MDFLLLLQELRTPIIEISALFVSMLCNKILLIAIFCYLFWCVNKEKAYGLAFTYIVSGILVQGIKVFARVPRPFVRNPKIYPVDAAIETATGYSFPSGHTQTATALLGYGAFSAKRVWLKILAFIGIFSVMMSRMILGVHTPYDVIVSFFITLVCVVFVAVFERRKINISPKLVSLCGSVVSALLFAVTVIMILKDITTYTLAHDCLTACICSFAFFVCYYIETKFIKFDSACTFSGKQSLWEQLVKFIIGLLVVIVIYVTFSLVDNVFVDGLKYALVFGWICGGYPFIIRKKCKKV